MRAILKRSLVAIFTGVLIIVVRCALGPTAETGGTGSEVVIGSITNEDGTPACRVEVVLHLSAFDPVATELPEMTGIDTTDSAGRYEISFRLMPGDTYALQGESLQMRTRCIVPGIAIASSGESTWVETGVLRQTGGIRVYVNDTAPEGNGYAYIPGTTFQGTMQDGVGQIDSVPEAVIPQIVYRLVDGNDTVGYTTMPVQVIAGITSVITGKTPAFSAAVVLNTTSTGADIVADVHDFPLLVRLTAEIFPFNEARTDGSDLRFTNPDNAPMPFEIERWDAEGEQAEIWIKIDTVYGADSSRAAVMYWGEPAIALERAGGLVFDTTEGFRGVWHLTEEVAGTGTQNLFKDATGLHNGDDYVSATGQTGIIGAGRTFDGIDDYILVNSPVASYKNGDLSISLWANIGENGGTILSKLDTSLAWNKGTESFYFGDGTDTHEQSPGVNGTRPSFVGYADSYAIAAEAFSANSWHHLVFTWKWHEDSTGITRYYLDGEEIPLSKDSLFVRIGENQGAVLRIGQPNDNESYAFFNGSMDELRLSSVERSADWIRLSYRNQIGVRKLVRLVR